MLKSKWAENWQYPEGRIPRVCGAVAAGRTRQVEGVGEDGEGQLSVSQVCHIFSALWFTLLEFEQNVHEVESIFI